jgi:transcription antitermination factor NusG
MVKNKKSKYVWAIGHINKDHIFRVESDLLKNPKFEKVEAYIPTIRVLSKRVSRHSVYDNIPIMMNYGFFKVTRKQVKDYAFMLELKESTPCLIGWLKNLADAKKSKVKANQDEAIPIAFTERPFINRLEELQKINDIYSPHELKKRAIGEIIVLKCYPFENLEAKILGIDMDKRKVKVELLDAMGSGFATGKIDIDFEHVFFTIYKSEIDPDSLGKDTYLEDYKTANKNHQVFKDGTSKD